MKKTLSIISIITLAACSQAPVNKEPIMNIPTEWKNAGGNIDANNWINVDKINHEIPENWWRILQTPPDAVLNNLINQLNINNQTISASVASLKQAKALYDAQIAAKSPQINLSAGQQKSGGENQSGSVDNSSASLAMNASWQLDLWGQIENGVKAQGAAYQASKAQLAGVKLSAQISLVQAYYTLRSQDKEIELLKDIIKGYEKSEQITQNRYKTGIAAKTDTLQAASNLSNAKANLVALEKNRALSEHSIALLIGQTPAQFSLSPLNKNGQENQISWIKGIKPPPTHINKNPQIPLTLPSTLLTRRPDINAALENVKAANARIGVAKAAYFPQINLTAGINSSANNLAQIISAPKLLWTLGAALSQYIFDGGSRAAAEKQAIAAHEVASANYRQTVLTAIKEVEDSLINIKKLEEQINETEKSQELSAQIQEQIQNRYKAGITGYTEVITAQNSSMTNTRSLEQLKLQKQIAIITLIQALGGGYKNQ